MAQLLLQGMGTSAHDQCPFGSQRTGYYIYMCLSFLLSLNKALNKADKEAFLVGQKREVLCTALSTYLGSSQGSVKLSAS